MDLISAAAEGPLYNFHSHTQFCDGRAPMEEFARAAAEAGFRHYGFSPHSPVPIESPCNMAESDVTVYLAEVKRLREIYAPAGLHLYAGMEIDYLSDCWGPAHPYFRQLPLDYRIGSVHFIPSDSGMIDIDGSYANFKIKMERYFDGDIRHVVESFYRQSEAMIEAGGFDIIGHFDKIGHNAGHYREGIESESWYAALVDRLIDSIIASGLVVELNTKAWTDHGRMFPGRRWLHRLAEARVPVLVNSDAHFPALIDASRSEGLAMLREAGFDDPYSR